nr:hypothetical protein [Tanacetum cinerariifolium]
MNQNHYEPNPCYDSNSFGFDEFQPPQFLVIHQPVREKTCVELLAEEHEANINTQTFQYSVVHQPPREEISVEFLQEKINQIDSVKTFLRKFSRISFYEMPKVLSLAWETILEIKRTLEDKHCQPEDILELFRRLHNDVQNIHEELAVYINAPSWDCPTICYNNDDDKDCTIVITPILSTEEPNNSLSMGDEYLDTILATKSDEFIKSSVEDLVPIPSESEDIPGNMCDVPFHDNSPPLDVSKDQFEDFFDSNDDFTSIDNDSFSIDDIEYVKASPPDSELVSLEVMEIVIPKEGGIDADILLTIKDDILHEKLLKINLLIANIKALKDNPTPSSNFMTKSSSTTLNFLLDETNTFDNSLPESKTFCFDLEEISSDSTTTHSDISLPDYKAFYDDHVKEISSGSTTTHSDCSLYDSFIFDLLINPFPPADRSDFYLEELIEELAHIISPPEYDCLCFKNEPNSGDFTMDVVEDIFPTREPRVHVHNVLPTHPVSLEKSNKNVIGLNNVIILPVNLSLIRDQLNAKAEAVQIIITGIDNDIYSIVDACSNPCEMWKAIERLKQGESINVQDLETNLYWEFGKFTSQDGESLESYYSRFYKMMNELIRNQCNVTNHQVNVQFLLQLQPEWQRVEKIARVANPLALVAQPQPVYHPQNHPSHYTQNSSTRSQQAATKNRGKEIVNFPQPIYDQEPSMVAEDDEMSKDKEIDKLMALISLSLKKIYKLTNNKPSNFIKHQSCKSG